MYAVGFSAYLAVRDIKLGVEIGGRNMHSEIGSGLLVDGETGLWTTSQSVVGSSVAGDVDAIAAAWEEDLDLSFGAVGIGMDPELLMRGEPRI